MLDSEKRIRGFYDISLRSELDRLEDEIKVQLVEEVRNNPIKSREEVNNGNDRRRKKI
ncbi:hypothetical protein [Sphingobacterium daejeonense]|uniref:hypothetical protein n=1 Tax=Sphingobacterium daejeonense TaxID=371142 RepID=UPI001E5321E8|nr:hypothetical protein [Sphingobacterium daejeonense]